ncbi:MAG: hypothetical protein JKY92_03800 [Magnetovibrio sp.]|nr:hypothetical protein [Magnetovibrio sp.]
MKKVSILALMALSLTGCSAKYDVAGLFESSGQAFVGNVAVSSMGQSGTIDVSSLDGTVQCTGTSEVTKMPSGYSLIGAQGRASATCNDGRTFKIDFTQSTETGGNGQGIDSNGGIMTLYFDSTSGLARSHLNQQRLNSLVQ